jgi:TPR repeat protein
MRWLLLAVGLVLWLDSRAEAACSRACPVEQRDEHGCCPARGKPGFTPAPAGTVKLGKLAPQCKGVFECASACVAGKTTAHCVRAGDLALAGTSNGDVDVGDALRLYQAACDAGQADGCAGVAFLYDRGLGVPLDNARAEGLYRKACSAGSGRACQGLAAMQLIAQATPGKGEPLALLRRAQALLAAACKRNQDGACLRLVALHDPATGIRPDGKGMAAAFEQALAYARARCHEGYLDGCTVEAMLQVDGKRNARPNLTDGFARLTVLCDQRVPMACHAAAAHMAAHGGKPEELAARATAACHDGVAEACTLLAAYTKEADVALGLYEQGCKAGDAWGCMLLAAKLGAAGKTDEGRRWRDRACDLSPRTCTQPVGSAAPPLVKLVSSCGLRLAERYQVHGGETLTLAAAEPGRALFTFKLPPGKGTLVLVADDFRQQRVLVMAVESGGTYMNHDDEARKVSGTIEIRAFDPISGVVDLTFKDVVLVGSKGGQCVLNGTVQTFGRDA